VTLGLAANPVQVQAAFYEVFLSSGAWDWAAVGSLGTAGHGGGPSGFGLAIVRWK
jgi:hypothetical protein